MAAKTGERERDYTRACVKLCRSQVGQIEAKPQKKDRNNAVQYKKAQASESEAAARMESATGGMEADERGLLRRRVFPDGRDERPR